MEQDTFQQFQQLAYQKAGIFLRPGKAALVQARLAKRLRELGLATERDYLDHLKADGGDELVLFLDAISTNFTKFFREPDHFEALARDVEVLLSSGQARFRIWCAGCSSGEEPYTVAMVLEPLLQARDWKVLATDISTRVLSRAAEGVYSEEEVEPIPAALRQRFLEPMGEEQGAARYAMARRLRERITFHRLNLANRPYPMKGPLDAVFCRNVMIYFDRPMRAGLVGEIERLLRPGAHLFIGHSETLNGIDTRLRSERPSVYRLPEEIR
ncbi:MAG TPA: protein-glutamate O-methyltransferase CheR [Anaeromyxobacter sp.]|nr:protein-glutamate O-methyltransferase CheR [Anaeromyxobacter sp.]